MAVNKINAIILFVVISVFIIFINVNEQKYHTRQKQHVLDHTKVIADAVWDFEKEGPEAYLDIAAKLYNYDNVSVFYLEDENAFLKIIGPEVNRLDKFLINIGLIPKYSINADIFYRDRKIAILKVVVLHKTFYLYFFIFLFLSVALIAVRFFILTIFAKQVLEEKVLARTKELSLSEEKYRELVEGSLDLIVSTDDKGQFTFLNNMAATILGVTPDEGVGMSAFNFIYPDDVEHTMKWFNESVGKEQKKIIIENRQVNQKTGEVRYITWSTSFHYNDLGEVVNVSGVGRDITDMKEAEEKKIELEDQLRQSQKIESIGTLAGGIAHDFNNMLSIILGNTEIVLEDMDIHNPLVPNLTEIQKAAKRSADLTRQLLAFARKQTISPKVLSLNKTIEGMLKMLRRLIGEDIDLAWLPKIGLWSARVDPSQIDQILANLCVNARDAIKGVGKITIETANVLFDDDYCRKHQGFKPGEYVMLAVSDNGCGMEKETMVNIFDPFFTTKDVGQGTGLGLATVYGIVKQNNGFINVYSELQKGTTLKLYFPRYTQNIKQAKETRKLEAVIGGTETILLVEDEEAILRMSKLMLERLGYNVLPALGPMDAIRIGESYLGDIHLLMTDVVMPEMSGRDLSEKISRLYPSMSCLFMSGYTANVIAHHGVLDEGIQFINKPFSKQELANKVRETIDQDNKATQG